MKTIGLLGGMSWESTAVYYRELNHEVQRRLGLSHSARCLLLSVDFDGLEELQSSNQWDLVAERLCEDARHLQQGGADVLLLCTNTMHKVADTVAGAVSIPFIHIVDGAAQAIRDGGFTRVGLLATRYTMEQDFYRARLVESYGIEVLIPPEPMLTEVHRIIYEELIKGDFRQSSRETYRQAIRDLVAAGAEAVILGCTEIGILIKPEDSPVPVFDTAVLHARAAVDFALG